MPSRRIKKRATGFRAVLDKCLGFCKKTAIVGAVCALLVRGAYAVTEAVNSVQSSSMRTAVLISDYHYDEIRPLLSPTIETSVYLPMTLYFNSDGSQVEYVRHATSSDLERICRDDNYKNVVLVGHGTYNTWWATDREVTQADIREWVTSRKEQWMQLTCAGNKSDAPLGNEAADENYHYNVGDSGMVSPTLIAIDLLTGFPVLKGNADYTDPPYFQFSLYFLGEENMQIVEREWYGLFKKVDMAAQRMRYEKENPRPIPEHSRPHPYMLWALYQMVRKN